MSHTLDNCGANYTVRGVNLNRIEGPNAKKVYNQVNALFSGPGESVNNAWKTAAGTTMPSVSQTRWWSREEFWEYILQYFKHEEPAVGEVWFDEWLKNRVNSMKEEKRHVGANLQKLYETFVPGAPGHDSNFLITAFIQAALVVDLTKKVREATYIIEGDGPIAVIIIEILDSVKRYYDSTYEDVEYPNVRRHIANAVAHNVLPPGYVAPAPILIKGAINAIPNPENLIPEVPPLPQVNAPVAWDLESAWKEYCLKLSAPFMNYFKSMVMEHACIDVWKAASLADPLNMQGTTITPAFLRLTIAPLLRKLVPDSLVDRMIAELSEYEKACSTLDWFFSQYIL